MAKKDSGAFDAIKMAVDDLPLSKSSDNFIESVDQLINDCYVLNWLHSRLSVYNKLEYFGERHSAKICDNNGYYKMTCLIDSSISEMFLSIFYVALPTSVLNSDKFYSAAIELIEKHHISFQNNMKIFIDKIPTNNDDVLTKSIVDKIEDRKVKALQSIENGMHRKLRNTQYFLPISTITNYILSALSRSLTNYILIFMLHNKTTDHTLSHSSSVDVITTEKSRMNRQSEYFNQTKWILKDLLCKLSFDYEWCEKLESALIWYFVFSIIQPLLSSSHPIRHYSYSLAQAFVGFFSSKTITTDLLPDFLEKSNKIQELLDKINDHETNRLLYIATEFIDQTDQITNFGDIGFTFEFSASAAVLIAQNRLTELFDLYKVSTGAFGSGLTSSVSTLMEKSFRDVMRRNKKPTDKFKESFYLARADLRSKSDDWNGVYADLQQLINSDVAKSYCYKELRTKYEQASKNRTSILNKQQRIEYLLIRSVLCTSIGEFEDAFTALLDANYMVNVMKSVSSEDISITEKKAASEDDKIWSELQTSIETSNKYLQEHLHFSIGQSNEHLKGSLYLQQLADHFQKLNILIGTFSITYDERLHNFAFDHYFKALPSEQNYKYFNELNVIELQNILASFEKFLETLKECTKQAPFILDEKVFSDSIQHIVTFDNKYDKTTEQPNLFVEQYYQILKLNTHIRSLTNISNQDTTVLQPQSNDSQSRSSKASGSERPSASSDESDECCLGKKDSLTTTSSDTARPEYYSILSLDGGGIRGIFQAVILMEIERRTDRSIGQLFNCFAGTSTGGILACGLAKYKPKTAQELLRLYLGPLRFEIFMKHRLHPLSWPYKSKYSAKGLEKILEDELRSERLSDCGDHDLIIPTEILKQGSALFINTKMPSENSNGEAVEQKGLWLCDTVDPNRFIYLHICDIPLKDVARCTSAAAPLFPPKELVLNRISYTFYDGGYRHNHPASIALKWVTNVRRIGKENIFLLSIGNTTAARRPLQNIRNLCCCLWNLNATVESIWESSVNDSCEDILGRQSYLRITPEFNESPAMDDTDPANLQLLWEAAWETITKMDRTGEFKWLCDELLKRSAPSARWPEGDPPSDDFSYYPGRYIREPDLYEDIDRLFRRSNNFNTLNNHLSPKLYELFQTIRSSSKDPLRCPNCCKENFRHTRSLSIAAGIGHIPSILHYFEHMTRSIHLANGAEVQCYWNALHYAAANGEILAALKILYQEPSELINLASVMDENVLWEMKRRLETTTTSPGRKYTPSELAKKKKYFLMEKQLCEEQRRINDQLKEFKKRR